MQGTRSMMKSFASRISKTSRITITSGITKGLMVGVTAASVFLLGGSPPVQHPESTLAGFTSFDAPGAGTTATALQGTTAVGINASGEIVGLDTDQSGVHHGLVRTADGAITKFDAVGAGTSGNQGTLALGINTAGEVTGYFTDSQQAQHGFVRAADGTITNFDVIFGAPSAYNKGTNALGINDNGDVTGQYYESLSSPPNGSPVEHGFIRAANGAPTLFDVATAGSQPNTGTTGVAINSAGVVAGFSGDKNRVFHGFVRTTDGTITSFDAPSAGTGGYQGTIVTGLDASGDTTGLYLDSSNAAHGFIRTANGTVTTFDAPGAASGMLQGTFPVAINAAGTIVGLDFDAKSVLHAFSRTSAGAFTTIDAPGAGTGIGATTSGELQSFQGTGALGINDSGEISGSYLDSSSVAHGFVLAPQAAPATFAITGTAVSVSRGATTGNTTSITVTPSGNFSGAVALTATVTASPAGAQDPPTLSFGGTTPVAITGATAGTATLTIATTAASTASLAVPRHNELRRYGAGGAILACVLFFGIPARKPETRGPRWVKLMAFLITLGVIAGVALGCGGSGSGGSSTGPTNPGTTAGSYTVTVTGTSGATTSAGTVALTVQ